MIILCIRTPAFFFRFHDYKHENLEFKVMSMALKSSLDYYGYSCLCVNFTSNSIMVTQLARHQIFIHFAFFNMTSFYKFVMQWYSSDCVSVLDTMVVWCSIVFGQISLVQWFVENALTLWSHPWYNGFIQCISFMVKSLALYLKYCFVLNHANTIVVQIFGSTYHSFQWLFYWHCFNIHQ